MSAPFYSSNSGDYTLFRGDCIKLLPLIGSNFDMVFTDPPYFLSNGGLSVQSGKIVSVDKGNWDKLDATKSIDDFNYEWLSLVRQNMREEATIWVSGTAHNIFSVGRVMDSLDYKLLNVIVWEKTNPPPNFSHKYFNFSAEYIIWARKERYVSHYFNYELMKYLNNGKQMKDVWRLPAIAPWEKSCGKHPTQKPLALLAKIILASTRMSERILDPFAGSGTTGIAANLLQRAFVGIERENEYVEMAATRRNELENATVLDAYRKRVLNTLNYTPSERFPL